MTWLGEQLGRIADEMPERDLGARAIAIHRRRRRNVLTLAAAAVVVVTMLAATVGVRALSAQPPAATRPPAPPELSTISIGLVPTVESAPVMVAMHEGYFKEEGLTVEMKFVTGAAAAVPQVEAGMLDLAQTDYATVFRTNEAGKEFKIVAGLYQAAPGSFAIVVNARSKIRTVADLRRKKVAVPNLTGLGPLTLTGVLKRAAGLTLKDVTQVETPNHEMLNALAKGRVDAALLAEPFVTTGRLSGRTRIVADAMTADFANLYTAGVTATEKWISRNPRTLAAFQRALAKAQRLIARDPQQAREMLPRYMKVTMKTVADVELGAYPAELDVAELQRVADLAHTYGLLRRPAPDAGATVS
ncbi:MAG: ABC transporter substrate-binding protein [Nonomuraea sp.]|nr:ABC transporter substrate-binding protein [Nonomuraea sp.]